MNTTLHGAMAEAVTSHRSASAPRMGHELGTTHDAGGQDCRPASAARDAARNVIGLAVTPRTIRRWLLATTAALVVASTLGQAALRHWPDATGMDTLGGSLFVDNEASLPTAFSIAVLLGCTGVLALLATVSRRSVDRHWRAWASLAVAFLGLSADEYLSLHERTIAPMRGLLGDPGGFLSFAWVVPGAGIALAALLVSVPFLVHLPARTRHRFLIAGGLFVSGALGFEMLGGLAADRGAEESWAYIGLSTVEETLEMLGSVVFLHALLEFGRVHLGGAELRLRLDGASEATAGSEPSPGNGFRAPMRGRRAPFHPGRPTSPR